MFDRRSPDEELFPGALPDEGGTMTYVSDTNVAEAYCPHCYLLVETGVSGAWPAQPARCPHCRLMIGAGRARASADGIPGARGAAAGVMAERARHVEGDPEHSEAEIGAAIRMVAADTGVAPERLLMVDYQQQAVRNSSLPQLHDVLGVYGSWKRARREAANSATGPAV